MNQPHLAVDATDLLNRVAEQVPDELRANVVVIGSIAAAWAFRDLSGTATVATKDIDLMLRPAIDAVTTAETIGQALLAQGWQPRFARERPPGDAGTPAAELPALRLTPPGQEDGWFVELLAEPPRGQSDRKYWRRFHTPRGDFGLPSFRYLPVAVFDAEVTPSGLSAARPAGMALAHLLEHATPDRTPISGLPGNPPRFVKDVGRAIALWWLARELSGKAEREWRVHWSSLLAALYPGDEADTLAAARGGLEALDGYVRDAHQIAMTSVLASYGTPLPAFERARADLRRMLER